MGQQDVQVKVAKMMQARALGRLDVLSACGFACILRPDAPHAQDGQRFIAHLMRVRHAGFQAPHALVGIDRKEGSIGLYFQVVRPGVILVIAAHKDQRTGGFGQHRSHLWLHLRKVLGKAKLAGVALGIAEGRPVETCRVGEGSQVAALQDEVDAFAGFALPAGTERKAQQYAPVDIGKES